MKTISEFGSIFGVVGKALGESDFNKIYFTIFKAKVWKKLIF
jgi:hypothetical protein